MKLADFDFELPEELIATHPKAERETARLLHVRQDGVDDYHVSDLPGLLQPGDVLVLNDTKVIPARLYGTVDGKAAEITLHQPQGDGSWSAFAKPAKRFALGAELHVADGFTLTVTQKGEGGEVFVTSDLDETGFQAALAVHGVMPLPPYIAKRRKEEKADEQDYQTVYAKHSGAVAAPTAGLHFTDALLVELEAQGVRIAYVTLHVGAGTFLPVKVDNVEEHKMHSERFILREEDVAIINQSREQGGKVVSIGTTSMRVLETVADDAGWVSPTQGATDIFITPGYKFKCVDRLFTNFHTPRSTLFMLVSAFSGLETMREAYQHALDQRYRFYSYGDACLLERQT